MKLTKKNIHDIKLLRKQGNKLAYIAAVFEVDPSTVSKICKGTRRGE